MIRKIVLRNFKTFQDTRIVLDPGLNILVGANEAGKSTILEAVHLALTARSGRYHVAYSLTPHLVNRSTTAAYVAGIQAGKRPPLPEVFIELYFDDAPDVASLRGTNNSLREDSASVRLWIHFDDDYASEYEEFLRDPTGVSAVPIEYYKAEWLAFSGQPLTTRALKVASTLIDASKIRLASGTDFYLQKIIRESLSDSERVRIARAYAALKERFAVSEGIAAINKALNTRKSEVTDKTLSLSLDSSPTAAWESSLVPHLDDVPLDHAGGGAQSTLKILLALTRKVTGAHVILVEEPENHLAFPGLSQLTGKISSLCEGKQVILTTHSSFVLNKLGLRSLLLLKNGTASRLTDLPEDTQRYFKKLSGYDTLRMVLADTVILVEGPSDELIIQRAHHDKEGCLPIERGIDVLAVYGLAFKRFLDIAACIGTEVRVVTDNDGNPGAVERKYAEYTKHANIRIVFSPDPRLRTLEPHIVAVNSLAKLKKVLNSKFASKKAILEHIGKQSNKTEAALRIFESPTSLKMPNYVIEALDA